MKGKIKPGTKLKNKLSIRLMFVVGLVSFSFIFTIGLLVFLNLNNQNKSRATGNGNEAGGNILNISGDIITEFTWENENAMMATLGPDAISISDHAHTAFGGRASTKGLAPGVGGNDINLEIQGNALFDLEGIDIAIDYRRNEESGNFLTRGNSFNFGMEKGFLIIQYKVENGRNSFSTIKERTNYEVPSDPIFRSYRFIYSPFTGKAEIFVNAVVVWSHQGNANTPLYWKSSENIVIGKNMNGGGIDRPVFDNLVIRSTGSVSLFAESLLNFMLTPRDHEVKINWSTTLNEQVDYFTIERSINGIDFVNISKLPSNPNFKNGDDYSYTDRVTDASTIVYYRLRQTFLNGKFVTHPLSAVRFKTDKGLSIETVKPTPFQQSFDVSYYLPNSGRVWIQLSDSKGKIISTKTFEAPQGKNVHIFRDEENLANGEYSLAVIFNNKKVSTKIIKG
jgi:hypothetical protein